MTNINYQGTIHRISRDAILKTASNYTAEEYWTIRKDIGDQMKKNLNSELNTVYAK